MKIGIDLDGCVYDFTDSIRAYIIRTSHKQGEGRLYARHMLPEPDQWETWESWGMTKEEWMGYFERGIAEGYIFRYGWPIRSAALALHRLKRDGHSIHIVTHRPRNAVVSTMAWLDEKHIDFDTLTFAEDKRMIACDMFIDDRIENVEILLEHGVDAVLFDQPWNRSAKHLDRVRVRSWGEFYSLVRARVLHEKLRAKVDVPVEQIIEDLERPVYVDSHRANVLEEAITLTTGDRNNQYGPPHQDFQRSADMLTALKGWKLRDGERFEAHEIAEIQQIIKLSRLQWSPLKRDHWVDIAGYAGCGYEAAVITKGDGDGTD